MITEGWTELTCFHCNKLKLLNRKAAALHFTRVYQGC